MFLLRPINWASLFFAGLAFFIYYYKFPALNNSGADSPKSVYGFTVKCGLTQSNYNELNILYERYKDQGFEILAFPCNQFAFQEPGTNEEIEETVCTRFNAEFLIFDKIEVNGKNIAPLYKFLKSEKGGLFVNAIQWNFTKFMVSKEGKVVERYAPSTSPLAFEKDIQNLLPK
ncbi:Glutathione peroxidase 2 [Orobanche hederae]